MLTVVGGAGAFAISLVNVLYLIEVWRYSPLTAGLAATPTPFLAAIMAVGTARLLGDRDPRPRIAVGAVLWLAAPLYLMAQFSTEPHYLTGYLPAAALLAIGFATAGSLIGALAVTQAPGGRFAGATALNSAIRQFGAALGVAIVIAVVGEPSLAETESAFASAWLFAAICFGLVALGALALPKPGPAAPVPALADEEREFIRRRATHAAATPLPRPRPKPQAPVARSTTEFLADVPLFAGLDADTRAELAAQSSTISVAAGSWLFRQGDDADALYVIRSGRVHIVDETPGSEPRVVRLLSSGAVLGEMGLIGDSRRTASAWVRRDARLLRVSREQFEAVTEASPAVSRAVMTQLGMWLTEGRPKPSDAGSAAAIAVVALDPEAAAAELDVALAAALGRLGGVWLVGRVALAGRPDLGAALSEMLDRLERDYPHVVLAGGLHGDGDAWTDACVRQADRVLLVVADVAAAARAKDLPRGCDLVLLSAPGSAGTDALLDAIAPRATYRVGAGERRAEDVAALARRLAGRSVGVVLSGGGARGFAHIGVIEELQAAGVRIDRVAGTSMGAFIGALLAQGLDAAEIDARCYEEWVRRYPFGDYRLSRYSLVRGDRVRAMLERNLPGAIEDLHRAFFCVSVDLVTNQIVYHRRGPLAQAVGASMAVPVFVPPVLDGQRVLFDGGLMDNLPTEAMAADAEGPIIAVDAGKPSTQELPAGATPSVPTLMETVLQGSAARRVPPRRQRLRRCACPT